MKKNNLYTSIIWAAFGLYITFEGYRLGFGTFSAPKSGFLLVLAGIILSGLSIALFVQTFVSKQKEETRTLWKGLQWRKGIKTMAVLFVYALVLRWMGFLLSSFLLLLFLLKGLEPQRWRVAILISVVSVAVCYLIFGVFLESQFPMGILGKIFGGLL